MELENWYGKSCIGNYRKKNEDKFIYIEKENSVSLAVICDGMGGHMYGDLASKIAVNEISNNFKKFDHKKYLNNFEIFQWLENCINKILEKMFFLSENNQYLLDMGTTFLAALIIKKNIYIVNVGDSRFYIYDPKKNVTERITEDQNVLNLIGWEKCQLIGKNVSKLLTSALGPKKNLKVDKYELIDIEKKILLFSTDGFHDFVKKESVKNILRKKNSLKDKANELINLAIKNCSTDNITVLLIKI